MQCSKYRNNSNLKLLLLKKLYYFILCRNDYVKETLPNHKLSYADITTAPGPGVSSSSPSSSPIIPAVPAPHNDERSIRIYVDNSNIWINAKQLTTRRKRMKTKEDHHVRIDIRKLTTVVANVRSVTQGFFTVCQL